MSYGAAALCISVKRHCSPRHHCIIDAAIGSHRLNYVRSNDCHVVKLSTFKSEAIFQRIYGKWRPACRVLCSNMGSLRELMRKPTQELSYLAFAEDVKHAPTAFPRSFFLCENARHFGHVFWRGAPCDLKKTP